MVQINQATEATVRSWNMHQSNVAPVDLLEATKSGRWLQPKRFFLMCVGPLIISGEAR